MPPKRLRGKSSGPPPPRPSSAGNTSQVPGASGETVSAGQAEQALLQEIAWCLERLEAQMKQQNTTPKQTEEAMKTWKILSNPRTPLVKKRQVMRMTFGDYRQTMEQEERQYSIRPQGMTITQVSSNKAPKSKYYKSSSFVTPDSLASATRDFQFGFHISDEAANESEDTGQSSSQQPIESTQPYCNSKLCGNSSMFAFNFDITNMDT